MCELWCHFDYTSTNETMFAEDYIASMLEGVEQSFRNEGLMMTAPERLRYRDMPHNVPLTLRTLGAMRKAAKKMTRSNPSPKPPSGRPTPTPHPPGAPPHRRPRGAVVRPRGESHDRENLSPARVGKPPRTGRYPWRRPR